MLLFIWTTSLCLLPFCSFICLDSGNRNYLLSTSFEAQELKMDESQHEDDPTPMADSISQELLDSSSVLGRGLAPIVAAAIAEGRPGGVSQMTPTSVHVPGAYPFPPMGAYPSYSPMDWSMYGYDNRFQYGPSGQFKYDSSSRSQYGLPVGAQHAPLERSQIPSLRRTSAGPCP